MESSKKEMKLLSSVLYEIGLRYHRLRAYCDQLKNENEAIQLRYVPAGWGRRPQKKEDAPFEKRKRRKRRRRRGGARFAGGGFLWHRGFGFFLSRTSGSPFRCFLSSPFLSRPQSLPFFFGRVGLCRSLSDFVLVRRSLFVPTSVAAAGAAQICREAKDRAGRGRAERNRGKEKESPTKLRTRACVEVQFRPCRETLGSSRMKNSQDSAEVAEPVDANKEREKGREGGRTKADVFYTIGYAEGVGGGFSQGIRPGTDIRLEIFVLLSLRRKRREDRGRGRRGKVDLPGEAAISLVAGVGLLRHRSKMIAWFLPSSFSSVFCLECPLRCLCLLVCVLIG